MILRFCLLLFAWLGFTQTGWAERPNFIIFIADDMAWDDCGAYGHPSIQTENLDRIAREGMRFDRAYLTCSSCSPSRCSILTGRYPHSTGAGELHLPLPADQVLWTTPLREAGYYTAAAGKWHLGKAAESQFDVIRHGGGPGGEGHWLDVLKDRPRDKPFFFWFAATDPHRGYKPGAIPEPHTASDAVVPPIFPETKKVQNDLALYYDEIGRFDDYIGLIDEELARQGIVDDTFILVMSDNGRPFPRCKTTVYEDGVRTPFLVRMPSVAPAGSVSHQVVSAVDIGPTILELAGIDAIPSLQGVSFAPTLRDPAQGVRDFAFSEHNWHDYRAYERGLTDGTLRYVRNWLTDLPETPPADAVRSPTYDELKRLRDAGELTPAQADVFEVPRPQEELYDIAADPHCLTNLAADPAYKQKLSQLRRALEEWQSETDDDFPGKDQLTPDGFDRETGNRLPNVKAPHPRL